MKLFKLRGGIHPEGRKASSADRAIRALPLPPRLYVPLQQHVGAPAKPVVQVGDTVLAGQLIGAGQGNISAPVHAPTSGRVVAIGDHPAPHPSGLSAATMTIVPDGEARWFEHDVPADPFALTPDDIAARVGAAGIVGLGGATFPSAVKLKLSRKSGVDTLIINGGECEPYLTCDDRIMRERAAEIVAGIRLIQIAVGARHALVGIEDNKPEALAAMRAAAAGTGVEIRMVPAMYPMGWDKQMIQALLGREVPAEGRSADIGVLVHNVATAWAVQQTICLGRPLVSRIVTVSGGAIAQPCNLEVPIGTPVQALFDACGGFVSTPARLVLGGPMMGHQLTHTSVPVVKGSSGVLALTQAEIGLTRPAPCIRCATCVRACPVGLLPLEMAARIRNDDLAGAVALGLKDCIGCGSCSYVCPSSIPLVHYFNYAKGELMAQARSKLKQEATKKLADERNARMERIAREREEAAAARKAAKAAREAAAKVAAATEATA
ncbi:electron transport complex subunit RsxC [Thiobacillus sp.]|uniref:electron transport complex subunit RsxC n=1 Tax=Thiobacillus sp. TaxID=924 RepID=UPI0011DACC0E|nr:electron transport complex subunit RsxC [Thiobacillus sp.]TXH74935.1 MAG: electron transport complex subunit RsxC [Thiobacillus sp.]